MELPQRLVTRKVIFRVCGISHLQTGIFAAIRSQQPHAPRTGAGGMDPSGRVAGQHNAISVDIRSQGEAKREYLLGV